MVYNNIRYQAVNITSELSYNTICSMKYGEGIPNKTSLVYPEALLDVGLFFTMLAAFCGIFLNLLVIITLLHDRVIRKEKFTPIIISIATCDLLFSAIVLPINSTRCYYRLILFWYIIWIENIPNILILPSQFMLWQFLLGIGYWEKYCAQYILCCSTV